MKAEIWKNVTKTQFLSHDNVEKTNTNWDFISFFVMTTSRKWTQKIISKKWWKNMSPYCWENEQISSITFILRHHSVDEKMTKKIFTQHIRHSERMCRTLVVHPTKKGGYTTSKKSKSMPLLIQYHSNPIKLIRNGNFNTTIPYKTKERITDERDHDENSNFKIFYLIIFWWSPYCCKFENHTYPKKKSRIFLH